MNKSTPSVLVVGGGVAGMAAAKTLDDFGISVHLVEKRAYLGGKAFDWACMATNECQNCGACLSAELTDKIDNLKNTTIHLKSSIAGIKKNIEGFETALNNESSDTISTNAVLLATGMTPFDASKLPDLGYGVYDQVITTADLNNLLKQERLKEILPDNPSPAIAFIQCVGSRNREQGRDYCSQVCCKTAMRQANKILNDIPEAQITVFNIDLQVIGKEFRTQAAYIKSHINLIQGVPGKILSDHEKEKLTVIHEHPETGARTARHFDLIVLAVGIGPCMEIDDIAQQLDVKPDQWGFVDSDALPPGIYAAGVVQGPTDILSAKDQGIIAANKIIQDLNISPETEKKASIVVLGESKDSGTICQSLAKDGWQVLQLNTGNQQSPEIPGVKSFTGVSLRSVKGTVGQYELSFIIDEHKHCVKAAAIIVASDTQMVADTDIVNSDKIQSLSQFINIIENTPAKMPKTVAFWLDRHGQEWKDQARTCLNLAITLAEKESTAVIIMEKMLVHGLEGNKLYNNARNKGVRFLRVNDPAQVSIATDNSNVVLEMNEATLPGIRLTLECDMLVIPEIIGLPVGASEIAGILRQQCDVEGFLQSANVRHRNVGSPRRGIFFIGSCHDETDKTDTKREIKAVKASLEALVNRDVKTKLLPAINENKCARCLTCYRVCPHSAVIIKNNYRPVIVPDACFGCGICVSHCPAEAIAVVGESDFVSLEKTAPETVIFACERSGELALKSAKNMGIFSDENSKIIHVPCAGRIGEAMMLQQLLNGAKRVIIAACHEGNCRSLKGNKFAAEKANLIVKYTGLPETTIRHFSVAANEPVKIARIISTSVLDKEVS
ncbi:MAG: hydrogenase iron-sulfur subunit [Proteobacteria bacterium]|nr:hydrogenase iron-sulfur subunit [Pseudomonadota bacterium]